MLRVLLEEGKEPVLMESYDSPNDKTLADLAEIIASTIDMSKYMKKAKKRESWAKRQQAKRGYAGINVRDIANDMRKEARYAMR
ncbi:MAG: hypothetical protein H6Q67_2333 [Firmicutes bacterium]|nr:hypothetical protein [Bacillota bacterium]